MKATIYSNKNIAEGLTDVKDYKYPFPTIYLGNKIFALIKWLSMLKEWPLASVFSSFFAMWL